MIRKSPIAKNYCTTAPKADTSSTLRMPMMHPASSTPPMQASTLFLKPISSREAARVPVHAPVPGRGIPTNSKEPRTSPGTGLRLKLLAAPLTLFQTEGEEPSDDRLILAPKKDLPGEEIDKRHRQHIPHDGNEIRQPQRHPVGHAVGDGAPQLDEGTMDTRITTSPCFICFPTRLPDP